ncbi:efflux RND transporter periplasmic adaptor subunit [Parvibaculum sp.]|uniref:efflux RND transporter periplasmic adaptor subunit n=1 Tax=Parvibaculum sp. TaxID=2024848 RepID=UPI003BAC5D99
MKFDTSSLKTFSPRTALIGVGAILIALFVVIFVYRLYGTVMGQGEQGGYPVPVVEVIEASKEEVDLKVSALGTLQADQAITVRPEITGIVTSIDFTDGTRIVEGDTIVTLDDRDLKARLMQSEARLTLTRANYQRAERLLKQGSGTARARDEALNDFKSAEAEVAATETALDKATIKAPFTGIIGLRQVSLGQFLTAGDPIATLADVDNLRIDFQVSEVFLTEVGKGQEVNVTFDALPDQIYKGVVSAVDPVVSVEGRALSVRAVIQNVDGKLRPGLFGRVEIVTETRRSIMLPEAAIVTTPTGERAVFKVKDGHAQMAPVTIGTRIPGEVEILSGVEDGETVIVSGQLKVQNGAPIEIANGEDTDAGAPKANNNATAAE